jgi:hypothetical protein
LSVGRRADVTDTATADSEDGADVTLYGAPTTVADVEKVAAWLRERIDGEVEGSERFLDLYADEDLPGDLAAARVTDPYERETGNTMLGIVRYEERAVEHPERAGGVLYDGLAVQRALNARLPPEEVRRGLHIVPLDRALGTWGEHDGRWHKRVNVLGQPALLSVPGLYEAPAKPESYYRAQQHHAMLSGGAPPREVLESEIEGEFLVESDPRSTEVLKGYALQAIHFWQTGEAFCENENCRLYNAHRQPEVIEAQLSEPEFCDAHTELYGL